MEPLGQAKQLQVLDAADPSGKLTDKASQLPIFFMLACQVGGYCRALENYLRNCSIFPNIIIV